MYNCQSLKCDENVKNNVTVARLDKIKYDTEEKYIWKIIDNIVAASHQVSN